MTTVPLYDSLCAGAPSPISDGEAFDLANHLIQHPYDTFYVRVSGDSMTGSGIFDGDLLIVDRKAEPHHSSIVVAQVGDGFTVKQFQHDERHLRLVPTNPDHLPIEISEDTRIYGVATFAIHRL